jgi:hypothetical protein
MNQLSLNFEAVSNTPLAPAPTARQIRIMSYVKMMQGRLLAKETTKQETAQRNADVLAWQSKMNAWVPDDQKAEDQLDLITAKADKGKPISKTDLKILDSLFLPDVLREILMS